MTLLNDIDVGGTKYKYANSIPMGTCATPAGSEVKECTFADSFELAIGNLISVTFTYANTYGNGSTTYPKLLINGTQYPVKQPVGGYASSGAWANGQAVTFMFDGTNLVFLTVPVVDTVASGNMNSVSSDAVAAMNYAPRRHVSITATDINDFIAQVFDFCKNNTDVNLINGDWAGQCFYNAYSQKVLGVYNMILLFTNTSQAWFLWGVDSLEGSKAF